MYLVRVMSNVLIEGACRTYEQCYGARDWAQVLEVIKTCPVQITLDNDHVGNRPACRLFTVQMEVYQCPLP